MPYTGGTTLGDTGGTLGDTDGTLSDLTVTVTHYPDVQFLAAFGADPMSDTVTWTDLSDYLIDASIDRGRGTEIEDVTAGTMTVHLDNTVTDAGWRPFDVDDTSSPYSGSLVANVRVRMQATWSGTTYVVYDGYVDDWPRDIIPAFEQDEITISAVDAFGMFADRLIRAAKPFTIEDATLGRLDDPTIALPGNPVFGEERSGLRTTRILNLIGWPAARRDIDQGQTRLVGHEPDPTTNTLAYLQQVCRSEYGRCFITAAGDVRFDERRAWTTTTTQSTSQVTITDASTGTPYESLRLSPGGKARIKNQITRAREGGREYTARNGTSIQQFGTLESTVTDLLTLHEQEIQDQANYVLARFSQPSRWVEAVTVNPLESTAALWPQILGRDLGDRITIVRTPRSGHAVVLGDYWIEGIAHSISNATKAWVTTWRLQQVDSLDYFTIGTDTIDGTTVLAY